MFILKILIVSQKQACMADFIVLGDEGDDEKYYALVKKNIEN